MGLLGVINRILSGSQADRPPASSRLQIFIDKDTGLAAWSDGTSWRPFGGGGLPPGVAGDGLTPGGLDVAGAVGINGGATSSTAPFAVGDPGSDSFITTVLGDGSTFQSELVINGGQQIFDTVAGITDGDDLLDIRQTATLPADNFGAGAAFLRNGGLNGHEYQAAMLALTDASASTHALVSCTKGAATVFQVPAAVQHITGALSTVTDPAAKAVLTSIIHLLVTGFSIGTDGAT